MLDFKNAEWIWAVSEAQKDSYADFCVDFEVGEISECKIMIAADSDYALYVNGAVAGFGQYADYPEHKVGDIIDISDFIREGKNRIAVTVWYYGNSSMTYACGKAGVIFEVLADGITVAASSANTLSRLSPSYIHGECLNITEQLGYTFHFDNTQNDGFQYAGTMLNNFTPSVPVRGIVPTVHERPIKRLVLGERCAVEAVSQGTFKYSRNYSTVGADMQYADLGFKKLFAICGSKDRKIDGKTYASDDGDGIYLLLDMGKETVGFLDIDIEVAEDCRMDVGYGEHIADGRCRTSVGQRNFSCVIDLKCGRNQYLNTFRRFGCRYIQLFIHSHSVRVSYAGIRPVYYPLGYKKYNGDNLLRNEIYKTCQHTLACSMHTHYEDCPWREQAMYTMDSRNQMLCGYYAFGEKEFAAASLKLIARGIRNDGLLSICYPSGGTLAIPSFSLIYFLQMNEYIKYTQDIDVPRDCFSVMETLINAFEAQSNDGGLINSFKGDEYWNFYEWSPTLDGCDKSLQPCTEAALNAFYSVALANYMEICRFLGYTETALWADKRRKSINSAIARTFFDLESGLFKNFIGEEKYSVLTNALCLLCGAAEDVDTSAMLEVLESNGMKNENIEVYPCTLSMNCFRFDALLKADRKKYGKLILNDIDQTYLKMLESGATSFWETEDGERAFGGAGSLCHGWAALPIYYYETLENKQC